MKRPPGRGPMLTNCPVWQTTRTIAPVCSLWLWLMQMPLGGGVGVFEPPPVLKEMLTSNWPLAPAAWQTPAATRATARIVALAVAWTTATLAARKSVRQDERLPLVGRAGVRAGRGSAGARLVGGHRSRDGKRLRDAASRPRRGGIERVSEVHRVVGDTDRRAPRARRRRRTGLEAERVRQRVGARDREAARGAVLHSALQRPVGEIDRRDGGQRARGGEVDGHVELP